MDEPVNDGTIEDQKDAGDLDGIFERLKGHCIEDLSKTAAWRKMAREDYAFESGDQWSEEDKSKLREELRPIITMNRIAPIIDSVAGSEVSNRQEVKYLPRSEGDVQVNEVLTSAAKWFRDECDAEDEESDSFRDALICGMGWCLSDDAMVRLPNTHFATTRLYSGVVIDIDLENGQRLTGTANHPVLTDRGWKGLHEIKEGDNLINASLLERVKGFPVEQFDQVETRLKDKIDAFRAGRKSLRFITAPDDFYSDGAGSKVHVVYADSALLDKVRNSSLGETVHDETLTMGHLLSQLSVTLLCKSLLLRASQTAKKLAAVYRIHAPRLHLAGWNVFSQLVTGGSKPFAHRFASQSNFGTNVIGGQFFLEVEPNKFSNRGFGDRASVPLSQSATSRAKPRGNNRVRYSNLISDFFDWKPILEIEALKLGGGDGVSSEFVTRVKRRIVRNVRDFPVHDVGTSLGMFVAGNIITSNTETRLDYEDDPDGKPLIDRVDPLEMVWDSSARKKNLADKRRVFHIRRDIPIEEARALCPNDDFEDADYNATWVNTELDDKEKHENDGKFYDKQDVNDEDESKSEKRVTLVRAQWYEREPIWRVMNPQDPSQIVSLTKDKHNALQTAAKEAGVPPLKSVKTTRKVYKQAYLGRVLLEIGEAPCKDHFSFFCITGKRDRNKNCFYGLVRSMKDPQRWANKWLSQTLHIMNTTAKGGIVAERGVFDNDADAEESWAKQDAITWLKKGALQEGRWKEKPRADFPVGFYQLTEMAITSIRDVSGVNVETLGMREATQAASLEMQRKQSSMVILQPLFDSLRRYRKNQGRMLLFLIQNYLSDGRLIKIVGEEGAKYVPLVQNEGVATYDVIVDESPTAPDQKEAVWNMLQQILPAIAKIVPPQVYMALLKYSPLPTSAQDDIKKAISDASAGQENQPDPEVVKAENDIKIETMKAEAETQRLKMKTDAEIEAMNRKAEAQIEISKRAAQADIFAKMTEPKPQAVGEDGQPVQQQQDNSAAVLGPLLMELTQALKAMSGPKQIVYGQNGEPVGVRPMGA